MNAALFARGLPRLAGPLMLFVGLAVSFLAYVPGLSGTLHFDDPPNLGGLADVVDNVSAINFIAHGVAGPTGRPLALASFVPQAYAWPEAPRVFLQTNVCLHLLNGVLIAWLLYLLLSMARGWEPRRAGWTASASATLWMLLPILASTSLLIVQRMTLLSATLLLIGFIGYLYSRRMLETRPYLALSSMTVSVVLGAGLATLAKENGALLPLFILITEATLLPRPVRAAARSLQKVWSVIFLVVPAVAVLGYLALRVPYSESLLLRREFTASDRLLTQAHILWEYLYHAFLPATSNLGPFHDDHAVYTNWLHPLSIMAVGSWVAVAIGAVALRRRLPLFTFAVGWYVAGHLLESTTIPLELYFEHRNYVPLIGPIFALVVAVTTVPKYQPLARIGLLTYGSLLAIVLTSTTSLWGRPALAAELWTRYHPDSARATQYVVGQLENDGHYWAARRTLQRYFEKHPDAVSMGLHALLLSCLLEPDVPLEESLMAIKIELKDARYETAVFDNLRILRNAVKDEQCSSVTPRVVYDLAAVAASNPRYRAVPTAVHNLHILMAEYAFDERNLDLTMRHIEKALSARYTMSSLTFAVEMLTSAGLHSDAQEFVDDAREREPKHPLRAAIWKQQLAALDNALR